MLRYLPLLFAFTLTAQITEIVRWRVRGVGTTSQRPTSCVSNKDMYVNTTTNTFQYCISGSWASMGGSGGSGTVTSVATTSPLTGGTITGSGTIACATCVTAASALTADLPVIGAGSQASAVGTRQGNTTKYTTYSGSAPATNDCAKFDANGNLTTAGAACGTSTGLGDPGSNGIVYRDGAGTSAPATATEMKTPLYCADSGGDDAYTCSPSPCPSAYAAGQIFSLSVTTGNTGAATVDFCSLGVKTIKKAAGGVTTDLATDDIRANQYLFLQYDGTNMQMQSLLGNAPGAGGGSSITYGAYGSLPGTCTTGDLYRTSDSIYEFQCTASNTWSAFFGGQKVTIPVSGDFSWVNQGSSTVTSGAGNIAMFVPASGSNSLRVRVKSIPAVPYTIEAGFYMAGNFSNYAECGLVFRQTSDGKLVTLNIQNPSAGINSAKWTGATTFSASYSPTDPPLGWQNQIWFRIADNNTNRIASWSPDNVNYYTLHTVGRTDFLTADQVGFYCNTSNSNPIYMNLFHWREF